MMKKNLGAIALCIVACTCMFITQACDDPTEVGVGIVTGQVLEIKVAELDVAFEQREGTPITTWVAPGLSQQNHGQCGILQDDVFGRTEASFSMQFHSPSKRLSTKHDRIIDSVRLYLYLDSAATYGVVQSMSLQVMRLTERIDGGQTYNADHTFAFDPTELASITFTPNFASPADSASEQGPFVRIPLPNELGEELFNLDSTKIARDSAFIENFRGFHIQSPAVTNCLLGFKPFGSTNGSVRTGLRIYYKDSMEMDSSLIHILSPTLGYFISPVVQQYKFDYAGSEVERQLANPNDTFYVQGLGGTNVEMTIPDITTFGGAVVNKAELFIPFDSEILEYSNYPEIETIFMTQEGLGGNQQFIPEFLENNTFRFSPIGRLDTINSVIGYLYNIPVHTQNLINQTIFDKDIRLQSVSVSTDQLRREAFGPANLKQASARSVIFGRNLSEAIRLKISYTE